MHQLKPVMGITGHAFQVCLNNNAQCSAAAATHSPEEVWVCDIVRHTKLTAKCDHEGFKPMLEPKPVLCRQGHIAAVLAPASIQRHGCFMSASHVLPKPRIPHPLLK